MSDVPLPEPWSYCYTFETETSRHLSFSANKYNGMPPTEAVPIYTKNQLHAYAAAVSAADNARLREAIQHYEAALKEAWPEGAKGKSFEHWNSARIAIHGSQP
jgi:hypothetical protein